MRCTSDANLSQQLADSGIQGTSSIEYSKLPRPEPHLSGSRIATSIGGMTARAGLRESGWFGSMICRVAEVGMHRLRTWRLSVRRDLAKFIVQAPTP